MQATEVCKQFLAGKCSRSTCKFLHDATANGKDSNQKAKKKKQSVCRDFLRGACQYGPKCKFSHSEDKVAKDLSLKVCHLFKKGMCRFGNKCLYGHVQKEAAICRSFLAGRCTYGALCKFLHTVCVISLKCDVAGACIPDPLYNRLIDLSSPRPQMSSQKTRESNVDDVR